MIRHLLQLIWNQRRQNSWIAVELFLVFILLWYILDFFITLGYNNQTHIGYDVSNVYKIQLATIPESSSQYTNYDGDNELVAEDFLSIVERIRKYSNVEDVCISQTSVPYSPSYVSKSFAVDTTNIQNPHILTITPSYFSVFRIKPINGGSPKELEEIMNEKGIIISNRLSKELFGEKSAIGEFLINPYDSTIEPCRILGVTAPIKRHDYDQEEKTVFESLSNADLIKMREENLASLEISIRVKPGLNKSEFIQNFKNEMQEQIAIGNFVLSRIESFENVRNSFFVTNRYVNHIRYRTAFLVFLLVNIFLGIIGTFWLRNEYRKSEIGLRIALGSNHTNIRKMMIGEGWIILSIVTIPAMIVCINIVNTDLVAKDLMEITPIRILLGFILTFIVMLTIITLAAWYPAYLASQTAPADTLKAE